jgi:hypothetical protein
MKTFWQRLRLILALLIFHGYGQCSLMAPALASGNRHNPPPAPPPVVAVDNGGGGHSWLEKTGIFGIKVGAVFCLGKWIFTPGSCADYFREAPLRVVDADPNTITPANLSGDGSGYGGSSIRSHSPEAPPRAALAPAALTPDNLSDPPGRLGMAWSRRR